MSNKKYWQNFGEMNQSEAFNKSSENEFNEQQYYNAELVEFDRG
jgi:molybdopterin-containing oxidoreductase family iron-sulfur binding subunit